MNNLSSLIAVLLYVFMIVCFFTAIVVDAMHSRAVWVIVDILISPIAVVRGFLIIIGVV